jgi:D-3-phosphoglycerate dehydrogenase
MPAPLKVLVVPSLLASRPSAYLTHLEAAGLEVLRSPLGRPYGEAELIDGLRGVFATVAGVESYTERVLREARDLEVIARFGVGYDQVDVPAATRHGVYVAMTFGANHETVADLALALMGAVARNVVVYHQRVMAGGWGWEFRPGLWRSTVGIVGLGRIGRAVARRCRAYEMRVLAHDVAPDAAYARSHGIELTSLEQLLRESDFVTLHAPHLPETDGLINAARLQLMKPSAFLINTARGGLVDEAALHEALVSRRIAGAGLDVFRREPPTGSPLLTLDNVVVTPHAAGSDLAAEAAMGQCCVESILAVARGGPPPAPLLLNPEALAVARTRRRRVSA